MGGINSLIESLFSCHKCKGINNIPFVIVHGGLSFSAFESLAMHDLDLMDSETEGFSVECK